MHLSFLYSIFLKLFSTEMGYIGTHTPPYCECVLYCPRAYKWLYLSLVLRGVSHWSTMARCSTLRVEHSRVTAGDAQPFIYYILGLVSRVLYSQLFCGATQWFMRAVWYSTLFDIHSSVTFEEAHLPFPSNVSSLFILSSDRGPLSHRGSALFSWKTCLHISCFFGFLSTHMSQYYHEVLLGLNLAGSKDMCPLGSRQSAKSAHFCVMPLLLCYHVFALPRGNVPAAGMRSCLVAVACQIQSSMPRRCVPSKLGPTRPFEAGMQLKLPLPRWCAPSAIGPTLDTVASKVDKLELRLLGGNPHITGEAESYAEGLTGGTLCPLFALPMVLWRIPPLMIMSGPYMGPPRQSKGVKGRAFRFHRGFRRTQGKTWGAVSNEPSAAWVGWLSWNVIVSKNSEPPPIWRNGGGSDSYWGWEASKRRRQLAFGPQFPSDNAGDGPAFSLKCATLNCGGLSTANVEMRMAIIGH